jgi:malonyl CoA-acyl carrier protein transacylase/ribosomal protein S18 acetylase RimI-like enzyme/acyl carrier protein
MLDLINRYAHGFVAVPTILACRQQGLFDWLHRAGPLTGAQLAQQLGANEGHLRVALHLLQSLAWLAQDEEGAYTLTAQAELARELPADSVDLLRLPVDSYLTGREPAGLLRPWIDRSQARWGVSDPLLADFLDGLLVIPLLRGLHTNGLLHGQPALFANVRKAIQAELSDLFLGKGWAAPERGILVLSEQGWFMIERALLMGTVASYAPMLLQMPELLFGDPQLVFGRDERGHERHLDRTLNVISSGFQHGKYFAAVDEIILTIFNQPIDQQPHYVADMGCGDGAFLARVYEVIRTKSARGPLLDRYPLRLIGVDYNQKSLAATARTLAQLPHLVLHGDIGNPEQLLADLRAHGIDPEEALHIRSFLDHDRPFIPPQDLDRAAQRARIPYGGVYVDERGGSIPPAVMVQSLVEHLARWAQVVTRHGLLLLEVYSLPPAVVARHLDLSESLHFDAFHGFSMQQLVEADLFLMAAAEAGLFPKVGTSQRYPATLPFTRITLHHFEKRAYRIRHPRLDDLPALVELETLCWPAHLCAAPDELRQRIQRYPQGQCLLELDGRVVGAIYSQRIASVDQLATTTVAEVSALHTSNGPVVQLLAANVLPEVQHLGLGDQLLEFMLEFCALNNGVAGAAGVTRCKNYVEHATIPLSEYIGLRNQQGHLFDPILHFHESHGAVIKGILPGYRPEDVDNQGQGILIEYDLHNRQSNQPARRSPPPEQADAGAGSIAALVADAIRTILGPRRAAAFAPERSLADMGLDSLELLELRSLLGQRLGQKLDSTFFFRYGTAQAIVQSFQLQASEPVEQPASERPWHILTLTAPNEAALAAEAAQFGQLLAQETAGSLGDLCDRANTEDIQFDYRLAIATDSRETLGRQLDAFVAGRPAEGVYRGQRQAPPQLAFLFTGQGSQYLNMGRELYETQPVFRQALNHCDELLQERLGTSLLTVLYPGSAGSVASGQSKIQNSKSKIDETVYTQPALFALEYALAELWKSWGIAPDFVLGHSVGEVVAACVAGVFSLADGLKLIAERAWLMGALPAGGGMVAVFAGEAQVQEVIRPHAGVLSLAAINGPQSVVLSGAQAPLQQVVQTLAAQGIKTTPLTVSHAFHSPLMEPMLAEFAQVAGQISYAPPKLALVSNVTGKLATDEVTTPAYWVRHVREPVRFAAGMNTLYQHGATVLLELGPRPVLIGLAQQVESAQTTALGVLSPPQPNGNGATHRTQGGRLYLASLRPGCSDWQQLLESLGELHVRGVEVDWTGLDRPSGIRPARRKVALPSYP